MIIYMKQVYDVDTIINLLKTNSLNDILIFNSQKSSEVISIFNDRFYLCKYLIRQTMIEKQVEELTEKETYDLINKRLNRKSTVPTGKKISGQLVDELNARVKDMQKNMWRDDFWKI